MEMRVGSEDKIDILAVARASGVSPATVSRAFNHPELVKLTTRRRIEAAVEALGYIRNRAARTIHGRRSATIGLVVPTMTSSIFAEVTQAFSEVADAAGFTILMATHGYDLKQEVVVLRKLLEHRVDGVALIGLDHAEAVHTLLAQQKMPSVAMWNHAETSVLPCVGADNTKAGYAAARHLIALGHRRIGLVFPPTDDNERARGRMAGALRAFDEERIPTPDDLRTQAVYSVAVAKQAILDLLEGARLPSALLCGNDIIAQGAMFAAQRLGLRVPVDLSIMGIGDFPGSADMEPGLSTVRIPARQIGSQAAHYLTAAITGEGAAQPLRTEFPVELKARRSTATVAS